MVPAGADLHKSFGGRRRSSRPRRLILNDRFSRRREKPSKHTKNVLFFALDARTGKALWQFQTGGAIRSGAMSFLVGDKQHVAVAGGHALFVFARD
jgi:outer membrane protein assembly factor BamB